MFKTWCLQNYSTVDSSNTTHVFMDNGKIHVPDREYPEFLKKYYKALCGGEHPCIVERVGARCLFRFFLDIDLKDKHKHTIEDVLCNIYVTANRLLNLVGDIYICNQDHGLHIVYNVVVEFERAIDMCTNIRNNVDSCYAQYIDLSVYKTGLRMIGAYKRDELRCYIPYMNDLSWETFKRSILRVKSIQVQGNLLLQNKTQVGSYVKISLYLQKTYEIENITVKSVRKFKGFVTCCTDSKFCQNVKREHKNAKVYYVFDLIKRTSYQKCFCSCEAQMPFTSCRNYKSTPVNVPYVLISYLQTL
tara:strand:- start:1764 stop:2672 length:909 start_codon:yes stop_codon:yes gene_type:complete